MSRIDAVQLVIDALNRKNYGGADMLSRQIISEAPDYPWGPFLLAVTANHLREYRVRDQWVVKTQTLLRNSDGATYPEIDQGLDDLAKVVEIPDGAKSAPAYLLIKSWGYGFWADIEHVMASFLLAEMTDRIPVTLWGGNSYYSDDATRDCFQTFFNPVSSARLEDVTQASGVYFPSKWRPGNIRDNGRNVWEGDHSRLSGLYLLNRPESVVVTDFFTQILELTPWIPSDHWLHGLDVMMVMRCLYEKYFMLQADVRAEVDAFIGSNFGAAPVLGVHVRNEDKGRENANIEDENALIPAMIERRLQEVPDLRIFLMSDRDSVIEFYVSRFGERVFFSESSRTSDETPLTWLETQSRYRLGVEIIKDTYAGAACDYFIGNGSSNIPPMVQILKDWPDGHFEMIGENCKLQRNWLLHDW